MRYINLFIRNKLSQVTFCMLLALAGVAQAETVYLETVTYEKESTPPCWPSEVTTSTAVIVVPPMGPNDTAKELELLVQYEMDQSYLFGQVIKNVRNKSIKEELGSFKQDSGVDIGKLSDLIRGLGKEPPLYHRDSVGSLMQAYTRVLAQEQDPGLMQALYDNSLIILNVYERALGLSFPADIKHIIHGIYHEKKRHLDYIASQIPPALR